jgi:hypothetical protein
MCTFRTVISGAPVQRKEMQNNLKSGIKDRGERKSMVSLFSLHFFVKSVLERGERGRRCRGRHDRRRRWRWRRQLSFSHFNLPNGIVATKEIDEGKEEKANIKSQHCKGF